VFDKNVRVSRKAIMLTPANYCPICGALMKNFIRGYYICSDCKYMMSTEKAGGGAEVVGVDVVRNENFTRICTIIKDKFQENKSILDVGCSRGLFLQVASEAGFSVAGIDPDAEVIKEMRSKGYHVLDGFFPESEELKDRVFDVIIFNDSLEHIPDLKEIISGIERHLCKDGIIIVNIPTSDGMMYVISLFLDKIGIHTMYDRMWQKGFASPHMHYFNRKNLQAYFLKNGFEEKHNEKLKYYTINGLWRRIICKSSLFVSVITWVIMVILYPLFLIKSDCFVSIFARGKKS